MARGLLPSTSFKEGSPCWFSVFSLVTFRAALDTSGSWKLVRYAQTRNTAPSMSTASSLCSACKVRHTLHLANSRST